MSAYYASCIGNQLGSKYCANILVFLLLSKVGDALELGSNGKYGLCLVAAENVLSFVKTCHFLALYRMLVIRWCTNAFFASVFVCSHIDVFDVSL